MVVLLLLLGLLVGIWLVFNPLGWALSYGADGYPFNWRVFAGPWSYVRWVESQGQQVTS